MTRGVWEQGAEENFGPKRDEVTGRWRKLHTEELRDLYSSLSINRMMKSRRMRWAGQAERSRRRWVDNITMDVVQICWSVWTGLVSLRIGTSGQLL
jgi:hypothetical protein